MFTKFGVWEKEVQEFVYNVSAKTSIEYDTLMAWMKSTGLLQFQRMQGQQHRNHQPATDEDYKKDARKSFFSLTDSIVEKFVFENQKDSNIIYEEMEILAGSSMQHQAFFSLQVEIANKVPEELSRNEKFDFVVEQYETSKLSKPGLAEEIDSHLLLMREFKAYMEQQMKKSVTNNGIFRPGATQSNAENTQDVAYSSNNSNLK